MPLTSIKLDWNGTERRLQFITEQHETGLYVAVQACNEEWKPVTPPTETTDVRTEEVYHRELRLEASKQGNFVPQYSTNPEWNPGYIEAQDAEIVPPTEHEQL